LWKWDLKETPKKHLMQVNGGREEGVGIILELVVTSTKCPFSIRTRDLDNGGRKERIAKACTSHGPCCSS
jgi:hypothetical protein